MIELHIKKKKDYLSVTHTLKKKEQIDKIEYDIIQKQEIPHVTPPVHHSSILGNVLEYRLFNCIDIKTYISNSLSFGAFSELCRDIIQTIQECESRGIRVGNLSLHPSHMFFDLTHKEILLLYWPLISIDSKENIRDLFFYLGECYQPSEEDGDLKQLYLKHFDTRMDFDLQKFQTHVESLYEGWVSFQSNRMNIYGSFSDQSLRSFRNRFHMNMSSGDKNPSLFWLSQNEKIVMEQFPFTIGREKNCNLVIKDNNLISRRHLILNEHDGKIYIMDNHSVNGTVVNNRKIESGKEILLIPGSTIHICDEAFLYFAPAEYSDVETMRGR